MALGAAAPDVVWLVMREVLVLVASGVTVGLAAAWMLGRFVQSQLYEIPAHDVMTMAGAALLLTAVALSAGYVPAWRATRVNPVGALRSD
jgi:ABC-type antimicrobial peptide transport system permease subunit